MKKVLLLLLLNVCFGMHIYTQTYLSGTIGVDSILTNADSPYIINGSFQITGGATLTIDSSEVQFESGYGILVSNGHLNANVVNFTSAQAVRQKGDWNGIEVRSGSTADFFGCNIAFGGRSNSSMNYGMVDVNGGTVTIDSTSVYSSNNSGIIVRGNGNLDVKYHSSLLSNKYPVTYTGSANVLFDHNNIDINNNDYNGVFLQMGYLNNSMVLDTVNVPYVFNTSMTIQASGKLTIASDNIIKFNNSSLIVDGALEAIAENNGSSLIQFTSFQDDNLGGDTNNNGTANIPASRNWGYIRFEAGSDDENSHLERCLFSFGGSGNHGVVWLRNAGPTIDSCDFRNSYIGCEMEGLSEPEFTNNVIGSSDLVPLALTFDANPTFTNNSFSFSDNQYDAIGILGSTLVGNATLPQRHVTGIPNVTYLMLGRVIVPEGMRLTIDPGIVIKGRNTQDRLTIRGELIMDGQNPGTMITITSVEDDNFGNPSDTNKDGTQTEPAIGDWGGIMFEGTSVDLNCVLNYCRFQYANLPSSYYNGKYISGGTVSMENASPTITNSIIKDCNYGVYAFQASNPIVENNEFTNINYTPVAMSVNADPGFSNNVFVNEGWTAIGLIGEDLGVNGLVSKRNMAGHTNITYVLLQNLRVTSGSNLDISPGIIIKMNNNVTIDIDGGFKAEGLENDSIVITSIHDDNYGVPKDTRNDGDATSPSAGNWRTIRFNSSSDDAYNSFMYCKILFGGNNNDGIITYTDAGGLIRHTNISDSYYYGLKFEGTANPDCGAESNGSGVVSISNCRLDPIAMSLTANPVMSIYSPVFLSQGNGSNGILILEGNLNVSTTLEQMDVGGIYNIAFIVDQLTVGSGSVLTFDPGVVIKFRQYNSNITVNGALVADGLVEEPIVFTSIKDDSKGGDTNDDGNASVPDRNNWRFIKFNSSSLENQNFLQNCIINYGGWSSSWYAGKNRSMVIVEDSYAAVDSCSMEHCAYTALGVFGDANPDITNNVFANIGEVPVILSMFAEPVFSNNSISNIGLIALGVAQETYGLDLTIPQRNFGGFNNITYYMYRNCTVNSGTTIDIPAGTVFKASNYTMFTINGALRVNGTASNPVVFTHYRDDAFGNPMDTNDDGAQTAPSIIGYNAVVYNDISLDASSEVTYGIFRYYSGGVDLKQASPLIQNNTFQNCNWGVVLEGVSHPQVTDNMFIDLTYAPLYSSLVSYPEVASGNQLSGSTYRAIGVLANEELVQDVTLERKTFADVVNIPYYFHGNYSIGTSVVLSINPGVVCKFNSNASLTVKRGLMALGKEGADSSIVFTDIRDDYYQGDTNADSTATKPTDSYPWNGITFADEAFDLYCHLDYCVVRYAGHSTNQAAITTQTANPLITNSSITHSRNGIRAVGASNPVINFCDISGNRDYGIENVNKAFTIDATHNFWGDNSGPTHSSNPGGTGDAITDFVDWEPFLTNGFSLPLMGDVSLNGLIQAYDASLILQYAVDPVTYPLNATQMGVADVDDNTFINANDASLVLQYAAGMIQTFPAELKSATLSDDQYEFTINNLEVEAGSYFNLPVYINNAEGLRAVDCKVKYDPGVIQVHDISLSVGSSAMIASKINQETGKVNLAIAAAGTVTNDGILLIINGEVLGDAGSHTSVSLSDIWVNGQEEAVTVVNGGVDVQIATGIHSEEVYEVAIHPLYPNPADEQVWLSYSVKDENTFVSVGIYQMNGALLKQVVHDYQSSGQYKVNINDLEGLRGTYIVRVVVGDMVKNQKLIIK